MTRSEKLNKIIEVMEKTENDKEFIDFVKMEIKPLVRAAKEEEEEFNKKVETEKLTNDIEVFLSQTEPMRPKEIARRFGVTTQKVTYVLRKLEEENKVHRKLFNGRVVTYYKNK